MYADRKQWPLQRVIVRLQHDRIRRAIVLEGPLDSEKRPVARSRREVPCTRDAMAQADRCESGAGRIPGGIVMAVSGASWLVAPVGTHPQFTGADFTDDDLLYAKTAEDFVRGE